MFFSFISSQFSCYSLCFQGCTLFCLFIFELYLDSQCWQLHMIIYFERRVYFSLYIQQTNCMPYKVHLYWTPLDPNLEPGCVRLRILLQNVLSCYQKSGICFQLRPMRFEKYSHMDKLESQFVIIKFIHRVQHVTTETWFQTF